MYFDNIYSIAEIGKQLHWMIDDPTIDDIEKENSFINAGRRINELVNEGHCINETDKQGHTILAWLTICQNWNNDVAEFVKQLVKKWKVNVNHKDNRCYTPLIWATIFNRPNVIKLLLSLGADPKMEQKKGKDALYFAKECDNQEALQALE